MLAQARAVPTRPPEGADAAPTGPETEVLGKELTRFRLRRLADHLRTFK